MLLFGFHQLLEEGIFSGTACSGFRQLGLSGCSSDPRLQLALGDGWLWWRCSRQIGEGLVEHGGNGRRVTAAALWLRLLRLEWRRWR